MLILVTYDVNTETKEGRRRLRRVAKMCMAHGQRVQKSVFECSLDISQYKRFCFDLVNIIELSTDSLRFYQLGNNFKSKIEHYGVNVSSQIDEPLIV